MRAGCLAASCYVFYCSYLPQAAYSPRTTSEVKHPSDSLRGWGGREAEARHSNPRPNSQGVRQALAPALGGLLHHAHHHQPPKSIPAI